MRLLLDEMHPPAVASTLLARGHDVVAVAEGAALRSMPDEELLAFATQHDRRIVTENVKDFRRLLLRADESGQVAAAGALHQQPDVPSLATQPGAADRRARMRGSMRPTLPIGARRGLGC